jgi:glutamate--cysteine ligase
MSRLPAEPREGSPSTGTLLPGSRDPLTLEYLASDLRERAFAPSARRERGVRIGVEIEWIPVLAENGAPCPVRASRGPSVLAFLGRAGGESGWKRGRSSAGAPSWRLPGGGEISLEPGGQIEYSSPVFSSTGALLARMREVGRRLEREAAKEGVRLLSLGIDPENPVERTRLQVPNRRYRRLARLLERCGPAGARMMRQTAALHVNLDWSGDPALQWRVANALVPVLIATFANSPRYGGEPTGFRSFRAAQWRELERATAPPPEGKGDPVEEYLRYALDSPSILTGGKDEVVRPFREWLEQVDAASWRRHLTTLFPEVRPRGYLEIRCLDALPGKWQAAPLVFLVGILCDDHALRRASALLPVATAVSRGDAARSGLGDPALRRLAVTLFRHALEGAERLGEEVVDPDSLRTAGAFMEELTVRGIDPGGAQSATIEGAAPGDSSTSE